MSDIKITGLRFLTPVAISYVADGVHHLARATVNLVDRHVFDLENGPPELVDLFFPFMDQATSMPVDTFQASPETYEQAGRARREFEAMQSQHVGGCSG